VIVVDDDILIFPWQLRRLFLHLIAEPEGPHGFTGMLHATDEEFRYCERDELSVDCLCEVYAVTRQHLERYAELEEFLSRDGEIAKTIEAAADFMVISRCGSRKPRIHDGGHLFRCRTFERPGVAVHKGQGFWSGAADVWRALNKMAAQGLEEGRSTTTWPSIDRA
jgi:hypothetical protein